MHFREKHANQYSLTLTEPPNTGFGHEHENGVETAKTGDRYDRRFRWYGNDHRKRSSFFALFHRFTVLRKRLS